MQQLLLLAFGTAWSLLVNQPALAELANETYTFSGEVASTCSINGLKPDYAFSLEGDALLTEFEDFEVNANSRVKLTARYEIVDEVSGYSPSNRTVLMRHMIGGSAINYANTWSQNTEGGWLFLSDTPGTATVQIRMVVGPTPPPGNYAYRATITCWQ